VLIPGGLFAISVPNMESLTQVILGQRNRYLGSDHLNYFNHRTIRRLLETAGFTVEQVKTRSINPIVILRDLLSIQVDLKRQIADSKRTSAVKTRRSFALLRYFYRVGDQILSLSGRGDLLLVGANKPLQ
jgi:hypothetical protein